MDEVLSKTDLVPPGPYTSMERKNQGKSSPAHPLLLSFDQDVRPFTHLLWVAASGLYLPREALEPRDFPLSGLRFISGVRE